MKNDQKLLRFGRSDISDMPISILMSIMIFIKYLLPVTPKWPKIKRVQNLLKFGTFNISIMPISI